MVDASLAEANLPAKSILILFATLAAVVKSGFVESQAKHLSCGKLLANISFNDGSIGNSTHRFVYSTLAVANYNGPWATT